MVREVTEAEARREAQHSDEERAAHGWRDGNPVWTAAVQPMSTKAGAVHLVDAGGEPTVARTASRRVAILGCCARMCSQPTLSSTPMRPSESTISAIAFKVVAGPRSNGRRTRLVVEQGCGYEGSQPLDADRDYFHAPRVGSHARLAAVPAMAGSANTITASKTSPKSSGRRSSSRCLRRHAAHRCWPISA
jgi:hypothetical protein